MIDPGLFTVNRLLSAMLDDRHGNDEPWRKFAEIIPKYMPPYPCESTRPTCVVRFGKSLLRYSKGPSQGFFWDAYGDDMISPELALLALLQAPTPPCLMKSAAWGGAA